MVEKNVKKLKAKKQRVMNGFNTGTRDMKLKNAYKRKKRWSTDEQSIDRLFFIILHIFPPKKMNPLNFLHKKGTGFPVPIYRARRALNVRWTFVKRRPERSEDRTSK